MKYNMTILIIVVFIVNFSATLFASVYVWTDKNGVKHFSNTQPSQEAKNFKEEYEVAETKNADSNINNESFNKRNKNPDSSYKDIKMPVNGSCEEFYLFIEGVCVHPEAAREDANEMKAVINHFKKTGNITPKKTPSKNSEINADSQCAKYKKRLETYIREGVMGINPTTGKLQKITGKAAEEIIQNTKDDVELFCND